MDRFVADPKYDIAGAGKFAPIIAIRGASGSGKNRLLFCFKLLSYRPYYKVSTARVPSLYRPLDVWKGTLCLDEADFSFSGENSEIAHYLNSRTYGTPISRQDPKNPRITNTFSNFGLTILTQRRVFDDNAIESRCVPYYSLRTNKHIPTLETDDMLKMGIVLQNKLLYLRFKYFKDFRIDKTAWIDGVRDHRLISSMLPLLALGKIEPSIYADAEATIKKVQEMKAREKQISEDGNIVNYLWDKINQWGATSWENRRLYYFNAMIEKDEDERGDARVIVPLTTSTMKEVLNYQSPKRVRTTIQSLNLVGKEKPSPLVEIQGKRYKAIYFKVERFEQALQDFVAGYQDGSLAQNLGYVANEVKVQSMEEIFAEAARSK